MTLMTHQGHPIDPDIVNAAIAAAEAAGVSVAEVSLVDVARRAGVSRSTLFRRIGTRQALVEAVRAAGVEPGAPVASARERALMAAREIIVCGGVSALTMEAVARRVGCASTSVHTQFAGRAGLLAEVFERYAPLPRVEQRLRESGWPPASFEGAIRAIYTVVYDGLHADIEVLEALFAEALAKPDGVAMQLAREKIVPRILATVGVWLQTEIDRGRCAPLPFSMLLPMLIAPIAVHMILRKRLSPSTPLPDRDTVIATMTQTFCRAVQVEPL